jgi:hypothetical protein
VQVHGGLGNDDGQPLTAVVRAAEENTSSSRAAAKTASYPEMIQ